MTPQVRPEVQPDPIADRLQVIANDGSRALWQLRGLVKLVGYSEIERLGCDAFDIIVQCVERLDVAWEELFPSVGGEEPCAEIKALAACVAEREASCAAARLNQKVIDDKARPYLDAYDAVKAGKPAPKLSKLKAGDRVAKAQVKKPAVTK